MNSSHNFLFVSDLHLSEGRNPQTGLLHRNEDFFQDTAFAQFLAYHVRLGLLPDSAPYHQKPWKLVVNGDIFDFLQVVSQPEPGDKYLGLRKDLSHNEKEYGLGTGAEDTVWKLKKIFEGHPMFFQALGWFVAHEGNELVVLKGNHDIELYWPQVQVAFRKFLVRAYRVWYEEAIGPGPHETPLFHYKAMPNELDEGRLETAVSFPSSYYYQKDLFYVEHGCQYEPANSFSNFENPTLPDNPSLIELPSGSLFVRYFFNKIEVYHPFADNMKPISRYISWLVRHSPSAVLTILIDILPKYLRALRQVNSKKPKHTEPALPAPAGNSPWDILLQGVYKIQAQSREEFNKSSRQTTIRIVMSILFSLSSIVFFLATLRSFVWGSYTVMAAMLALALVTSFTSSYLMRGLDSLLEAPYLLTASHRIARLLDRLNLPDIGTAPYFIFGHDHAGNVQEITSGAGGPGYRQWYVNTGAWVPVFSEEERLLRGDSQLTFLRLVPEKPGFRNALPELLQWSPEANKPFEVRLVEKAGGKAEMPETIPTGE